MNIFGIPIDNIPRAKVLKQISAWLGGTSFQRIATINPEFLLLAQRSSAFKEALLAADMRVADGVGLYFPFWLSGEQLVGHYPGADLMQDILKLAEEEGYGVALALHEHGLSSPPQILGALKEKYPRLLCALVDGSKIQDSSFKILFSNFGAPFQEIYLESLRNKQSGIRLAMGVGGALDFITGAIPRAPQFMRRFGLEWLWRLYQQPQRFHRIWNAVVVFPVKVLSQK